MWQQSTSSPVTSSDLSHNITGYSPDWQPWVSIECCYIVDNLHAHILYKMANWNPLLIQLQIYQVSNVVSKALGKSYWVCMASTYIVAGFSETIILVQQCLTVSCRMHGYCAKLCYSFIIFQVYILEMTCILTTILFSQL